ncbi:MAG: hypothetical protein ACI9XP_001267 [Lentimonas sp.]|jgi:hypothetical protein
MKKTLLIFALSICAGSFAQSYNNAIGIRGGETSGITWKHSVGGSNAFEAIFGAWGYGFTVTGLYEKSQSAFDAAGLSWYYGAGAHIAIESGRYGWYEGKRSKKYYYAGGTGVGIDGILGLEYEIPGVPIALSFDLKPFIEFNTRGRAWTSIDPGLGIKVTF